MLFNSWTFVLLMVITTLVYYLRANAKYQISILLLASFIFYAHGNLPLTFLLIATALINAIVSYYVTYGKHMKTIAVTGVVINLLLLALFKYSSMISNIFDLHNGVGAFLISLPLPLGISFYTFRGISLVVDVYKGRIKNDSTIVNHSLFKHIFNTLFFISFFPALVAGPIIKAQNFFSQISVKNFRDIPFQKVIKFLIVGYFLKMVIADNLSNFTFWMTYPYFESRGIGDLLLMLLGYSAQIFADFAGYSLIAIGVAALLGYELPINFRYPYVSTSIREFWKRWHITLSEFLMEYLYIPMGGSRKGKVRTYFNLFMTMTIGGLWHGAGLNYIVWGMFHGSLLVIERISCGKRQKLIDIKFFPNLSKLLSMGLVFTMVSLGWLLFALPDFHMAVDYLKCIVAPKWDLPLFSPFIIPICVYIFPVVLLHALYFFRESGLIKHLLDKYAFVLYATMLYLIVTNSGCSESFVYFQF